MTTQEVIEKIKMILEEATSYENAVCYVTSNDREALQKSIEALEKQTALERVVERLEEQAEECKKYWDKFDDEDAFGGMNAYMNSLAIIKEEVG